MNNKKFLLGTLAGGVAFFFLGFLVYAVALESFYAAHAGSATGVMKTEMEWWPLILGNLAHAALLSYIFVKWADIKTMGTGFSAGIIIGFFMSAGYNLIMYDTSNISDRTGALVDIVVYAVMTGVVGAIVGWVVGMVKE